MVQNNLPRSKSSSDIGRTKIFPGHWYLEFGKAYEESMPMSPSAITLICLVLGILPGCIAHSDPKPPPLKPVVLNAGSYTVSATSKLPLYFYMKDKKGFSACQDACAKNFPAEPAVLNLTAPFGSIVRKNGMKQLIYGGRPLYTYVADIPNSPPRGHLAFDGWIPFTE